MQEKIMPHIWYMSRLETGKGGGDGIRGGKGRARQAHTGPHTGTHRSRLVGPPALAVGLTVPSTVLID
jgi:hypothetical protein